MPISMIRYQVADAEIPEVTRAIETAFAAVAGAQSIELLGAYGFERAKRMVR